MMTAKLIPSHAPLPPIKRRDFLGLGLAFSTALLLPIALKSHRETLTSSRAIAVADPGWAIGFLPLEAAPDQPLVAAQGLALGDAMFQDRGAQVKLQRLHLPENYPLITMTAHVHYSVHDAVYPESIVVPAWSYHQLAGMGAGNRLALPVSEKGLTLSFDWQRVGGDRHNLVTPFVLEGGADQLKLQRGTYLIAGPRQSSLALPQWSEYRAAQFGLASGSQVYPSALDFPYLLIQIDYGEV